LSPPDSDPHLGGPAPVTETKPPGDLGLVPEGGVPLVPPEVFAQTLREYLYSWVLRLRSGESGMLPVVLAMVVIVVVFQIVSPHHVFLTATNLVNLFQQSAYYMVFAMAEIFTLVLGEIDLSIGYWGPIGGVIAVQLVQPVTTDWPWLAAIVVALLACGLVGGVQGAIVTRLRVPSFIVTLAFFLIGNGILLIILGFGPFSGYPTLVGHSPNLRALFDLMSGEVTPVAGWVSMVVIVALLRDYRRRRSGLVAPPASLSVIKIILMAGAGIVVVAICNANKPAGVPWALYIVLGVLAIWTFLLQRTRLGRYMYAIGGNAEAARRAGVKVSLVRTVGFVLCAVTAGLAGILYASYLGGMSNNIPGGQLVLFAVAAAVIGGTSLFGGRGKAAHGVLGGLVVGGIYNGMFLLGLPVQDEFIVTGGVLLFAVTIDAISRRGSTSSGAARA
jgi:D-xylose transport system permease protein